MLNERLKNLRLAKGMTLQQVGDTFGISKVSVSTWESGKTSPDQKKLEKLADLFGSSIQYLITGISEDSSRSISSNKVPFYKWENLIHGIALSECDSFVTPLHSKPSPTSFATRYIASSSLGWQPAGIPAGSILIIDPTCQIGAGDFLLVELNSRELAIVRVSSTPDNKKLVQRVDTVNFNPISLAKVKTFGVVLEWQISGKLK
jgi:transcriptional regulator with XRE-family HTH domain